MKAAEKEMELAKEEKRKVAHLMKDMMFQKGEVDHEVSTLTTKYKAEVDSLEKLESIFSTLKKLRALIREKGIQGYKGLLIDFIESDSKISACIDLAGKSKLFSIIVDDFETAK